MIEVAELTFRYTGTTQAAVRNLTFQVKPGEIFGLLGPSGAGKSTTQKLLNGLLQGYSGRLQIFGKPLRAWGSNFYERIGVSFELPNHFLRLTAVENLKYFSALYQQPAYRPVELLQMVGLANDGRLLVSQYSKGMKNRLSVARALIHDPDLLFLDEPTAGLDPVNASRIKAIMRAQKEAGKTIFLTTHDMHIAHELCDRVAFIVDGEIKRIAAPRALALEYGAAKVRVEYQEKGQVKTADFALSKLAENGRFLQLIHSESIQTMHTQEASLADIFIAVTGRALL